MLLKRFLSLFTFAFLSERGLGGLEPRRPGPPVVVIARDYALDRRDILIDEFETDVRIGAEFVLVRAWVRVPLTPVQAQCPPIRAARKLSVLPLETQRAFYLSASYGLTIAEVASLLGARKGTISRRILRAISVLDDRDGEPPLRRTSSELA